MSGQGAHCDVGSVQLRPIRVKYRNRSRFRRRTLMRPLKMVLAILVVLSSSAGSVLAGPSPVPVNHSNPILPMATWTPFFLPGNSVSTIVLAHNLLGSALYEVSVGLRVAGSSASVRISWAV